MKLGVRCNPLHLKSDFPGLMQWLSANGFDSADLMAPVPEQKTALAAANLIPGSFARAEWGQIHDSAVDSDHLLGHPSGDRFRLSGRRSCRSGHRSHVSSPAEHMDPSSRIRRILIPWPVPYGVGGRVLAAEVCHWNPLPRSVRGMVKGRSD